MSGSSVTNRVNISLTSEHGTAANRRSQRVLLANAVLRHRLGLAATSQAHMDVTPWVLWFLHCLEKACAASVEHVQGAVNKTRFWHAVEEAHPDMSPSQRKVLNNLYDAKPDGFSNGLSTGLYAKIGKVSRATAYRELSGLTAAGLLQRNGEGRGTRYVLTV